ncbi:uncharacterized protein BO72DRAFT_210363 [Aspergillus fijiensis CBS 313.89]|uniref:Uncharacterized protein n=1 Tax=Aspergillus fijiensis CBS 313.89 TaxID=1448319 RepID=A0A8G1RJ68_9EURO|nr:uncharacterized protein BO72DRAFT_210363 [Aspergillus fijiensis CBS 313.89]RAK74259.1 hypothetical protein BO72DRAFT_210363 [Aspergillus fijiensis CBS 313.89]
MLCRDKLACPGYRVLGLASKARIPHGLIHLDDRFKRRAWVGLGPSWGLAGGGKEGKLILIYQPRSDVRHQADICWFLIWLAAGFDYSYPFPF